MGSVLAAVVDLDWRSCQQQRTVHRLACCRGGRKECTLALGDLSSGGSVEYPQQSHVSARMKEQSSQGLAVYTHVCVH
jgi:hypothetical protein